MKGRSTRKAGRLVCSGHGRLKEAYGISLKSKSCPGIGYKWVWKQVVRM